MRRTTTAASSRSPRYFGKILPGARLADLVAGAADALQPARDRARRLDEHDEVDRAHVDAELEAADVATMPRSRPALSSDSTCSRCSRDSEPWCARTSSSPASSLRCAASRSASAARVAEHDRGAVRADQLEDARVHVRPDALVGLGIVEPERVRPSRPTPRECAPGSVMSSTGTMTSRSSSLREPASTIVTGRGPSVVVAAEEARDLVERALRRREPDALRRRVGDRFEPFEREHEVRAALGGRERVDLVDDHGLDAAQRSRAPAT